MAGKERKESREETATLKAPLPALYFVHINMKKKSPCKNVIGEDTLTVRDAANRVVVFELIQIHKQQIWRLFPSCITAQSAIPLDKGITELCSPSTSTESSTHSQGLPALQNQPP